MTKFILNPTQSGCTSFSTIEEVIEFLRRSCGQSFVGSTGATCRATHSEVAKVEMTHCINANDKIGHPDCMYYSRLNEPRCTNCAKKEASVEFMTSNRLRVRTLPSSRRRCGLTPDCKGVMEGILRAYPNQTIPQLWWNCNQCKLESMAEVGWALEDERVTAAKRESDEEREKLVEALGTEVATGELGDVAQHMRDILLEADDG